MSTDYPPPAVAISAGLGVLLMPVVAATIWAVCWVGGMVR